MKIAISIYLFIHKQPLKIYRSEQNCQVNLQSIVKSSNKLLSSPVDTIAKCSSKGEDITESVVVKLAAIKDTLYNRRI